MRSDAQLRPCQRKQWVRRQCMHSLLRLQRTGGTFVSHRTATFPGKLGLLVGSLLLLPSVIQCGSLKRRDLLEVFQE
jgi:hypothetical protein